MPKIVDHGERREALAEALMRLVERGGVEAVSTRAVAAEAGWSTGVLAHYFADADALLTYAFELVADRMAARADARARRAPTAGAAVRAMLVEALPADARRRREARLWFAYLERAPTRRPMAAVARRRYQGWTAAIAGRLEAAGASGPTARRTATTLLALVDGLAVRALSDPRRLSRRAQEEALDAALDRLLPRA
jgi:DNA-binding transcriptional regulator YbjK